MYEGHAHTWSTFISDAALADDARARARMSLFFTDISIRHSLRASRRPGATRSDGWGMRGRGTTTDGQNMIKTRHNLTTHTFFSGLDHRVTSPAPRRCGVGVRSFLLPLPWSLPTSMCVQSSVDKKGPNGGRRKAHPPTTHTHPHTTPTSSVHAVALQRAAVVSSHPSWVLPLAFSRGWPISSGRRQARQFLAY